VGTSVRDPQGSAYGRFRRALDTGNANLALAAAADLEHVGLADALGLLLVLESEPSRFERAALRWHGRYCREMSDVGIAEAQAVLACLAELRGSRPEPAAHALADLVHRHDLARSEQVGRYPGCEVRQDLGVPDDSAFSLADFDRYVDEHGIPEEDWPAAGRRVERFGPYVVQPPSPLSHHDGRRRRI
jgi:hypothetical protein